MMQFIKRYRSLPTFLIILSTFCVFASIHISNTPARAYEVVYHSNQSSNYDIWVMDENGGNKVQLTNSSANEMNPKGSKDGLKIVYTSDASGNDDIWVMNRNGTGKTQLTTSAAGDSQPIFTPDGTKVVFVSYRSGNGDVYIMDADGGNQTRLTTVNGHTGRDGIGISADGTKIAYTSQGSGENWGYNSELYSAVLACSGNASTCSISNVTHIASFDSEYEGTPSFTPDGKILWSSGRNNPYGHCSSNCYFTTQEIFRINLDGTGEVKITSNSVTSDIQPSSSPDGSHIIFSSDRAFASANVANTYDLWIVNSDGTGLMQLTDTPAYSEGGADWLAPTLGVAEKIVFSKDQPSGNHNLFMMNPDGSSQMQLTSLPGYEGSPKISPDGTKIAFISNASGITEVYIMNADGTNIRQLTSGTKPYIQLAWHPSGTKLYYDSLVISPYDASIRSVNIDGTGDTEVINHSGYHALEMDISPNGNYLVYIYEQCCWTPNRSIRLHNLSDGSDIELLPDDDYSDFNPRFSRDGNYIIWTKNRNTNPYVFGYDIWRMNIDGSSQINLTSAYSTLAFGYASFSRNGNKIVLNGYTNGGDNNIYIMNTDGTGLQQLTAETVEEAQPDFGVLSIKPNVGLSGDVDDSGEVDLIDAILSMQLVSGIIPEIAISAGADVNGNGRIGLEEAVYVLQKMSGSRPN